MYCNWYAVFSRGGATFRCCSHISQLEHLYFSSGAGHSKRLPQVKNEQQQGTDELFHYSVDNTSVRSYIIPLIPSALCNFSIH